MTTKSRLSPLGAGSKPYKRNTVLAETSAVGTHTVELLCNGLYEITLVGGGGGSSNSPGASGAIIKVQIKLKKGILSFYIGPGGGGCGAYARNNNGSPGTNSTLTHAQASITATKGTQGNGRRNGGAVGTSSVCTYNISAQHTVLQNTAGSAGSASPITGDYNGPGKAGRSVCDTCAGEAGGPGYCKITFIK